MMQTNLPQTSLIVCSRDRPQLLRELVASVLAGDAVPTEIVIVDDSDAPNEALRELKTERGCEILYLWTRARGLSRANNDGIAAARHDVLVFTQDDVLVSPTWFNTLVTALVKAGPQYVVTGRVPPEEKVGAHNFAPSTKADVLAEEYAGPTGEGILYVQNMAMYRSLNGAVGGFDERLGPGTPYPSAEDNDFMYRVLKAGYRILYCPDAIVYHRAWRSQENFLPLRWNYGLGRGAMYAKNVTPHDHFTFRQMLWDIRVHLLGAATRFRTQRQIAYGDFVLAMGIVYGAVRWWLQQWHST